MPLNKANKRVQQAAEAALAKIHFWTFETKGTRRNFEGKLKDEKGRVVVTILENEDYNQLSRLLNTSKYMRDEHDMKGLTQWVWERNMVPMKMDEHEEWNRKKRIPLDIKEVKIG